MKGKSLFAQRMKNKDKGAVIDNTKGFPSTFKINDPKGKKSKQEEASIKLDLRKKKSPSFVKNTEVVKAKQESDRQVGKYEDMDKLSTTKKFDVLSEKDAHFISTQNMDILSKMSPEELKKQRELLSGLLSKKQINFLKSRKDYLVKKFTEEERKEEEKKEPRSEIDLEAKLREIERIPLESMAPQQPSASNPNKPKSEAPKLLDIVDYDKVFEQCYFDSQGNLSKVTKAELDSTTNYYNLENNDEYSTIADLFKLFTSSVPNQVALALYKMSLIFKNIKDEELVLNLFDKKTGGEGQEVINKYEFLEALIKKFHKEKTLGFLLNKKNFNLLKNLTVLIHSLINSTYGLDFFFEILESRDPAYLQILDKIKLCVWGKEDVEMKINIFDKVFICYLLLKNKDIDHRPSNLFCLQIALYSIYMFPQYCSDPEFVQTVKAFLVEFLKKYKIEIPSKIDNIGYMFPKPVRESIDKSGDFKLVVDQVYHLINLHRQENRVERKAEKEAQRSLSEIFSSFDNLRKGVKTFSSLKSLNLDMIKLEIRLLMMKENKKKIELFSHLRSSFFLVYTTLSLREQKLCVYLMNQFKIIEFCFFNVFPVEEVTNMDSFVFNFSSVNPYKPVLNQAKTFLKNEHIVNLIDNYGDSDDTYNYTYAQFEPHSSYKKIESKIKTLKVFINEVNLSYLDRVYLFCHLVKFYCLNTNQIFLKENFREYSNMVIKSFNSTASRADVLFLAQRLSENDESFYKELISNYLYCSFYDPYFTSVILFFLATSTKAQTKQKIIEDILEDFHEEIPESISQSLLIGGKPLYNLQEIQSITNEVPIKQSLQKIFN